jgi:hypothetical protein
MARTDIHRPAEIEPKDYTFLAYEFLPEHLADGFQSSTWFRVSAAIDNGAKFSDHKHGGNCMICGAHMLYSAIFLHRPSNVLIRTGLECCEKLDGALHPHAFRKAAKDHADVVAGKKRAQALVAARGLEDAWTIFTDTTSNEVSDSKPAAIVRDIIGKLVRYGEISEKQWIFLRKLTNDAFDAPAINARRAAEKEAALPAPVTKDRVKISGTIVSKRFDEVWNVLKIVVKTADGWAAWGSCPSFLDKVEVGQVIEFMASLQVSDKDPKFAFFKRPTKVKG